MAHQHIIGYSVPQMVDSKRVEASMFSLRLMKAQIAAVEVLGEQKQVG